MRENVSRFIRSTFGLIVMGLVFSLAVSIHIWALIANYNALVQGFELIGFDQKPLADDPFYGWVFEAMLLGDATQCHLYAGFLVFTLAACFGVVSYFLFNMIMLIRDRKVYLNNGDEESARQAMTVILHDNLPYFIIFSGLLIFLAWWDLWLFYYRSLAGAMNIEIPKEAVLNISSPGVMLAEAPDNFALAISRIGGWGYLAATLFTSFFMKFAYQRAKERLIIFEESLLDLLSQDNVDRTDGVVSQSTGTTLAEGAPTSTGIVTAQAEQETGIESLQQEDITGSAVNTQHELHQGENSERESETTTPEEPAQEMPTTHVHVDEEVEVIGGNGAIRRSDALANPDRYYIDENGRFWDRGYYEKLHGLSDVASTEERPAAA